MHAYVPHFVSIGLFCRPLAAKTPNFWHILPYFGLRHLVVSPIGNSLHDKVEHGCKTTNLPLSNGIKIVSVLQRIRGETGRIISDVQKRIGQTSRQADKQTKNSAFMAAAAVGEIRAPRNLAW